MVRILAALALSSVILIPNQAEAQMLPSIDDDAWLGFFSGYKRRSFEFGVNNEGQCALYLRNSRTGKRAAHTKTVKVFVEVIVENEQGKLYYKRLKKDEGFATEMKAGLDHEKVTFTAESTGDAKVEITIKYDRDRIILDGKVLDPGKLKGKNIYLAYKVSVPAMYSQTYNNADGKKLKGAMKKDRIRFVRAKDGKRVSLKSYEEVDLADEKLAQGGVTSLQVTMKGQEDQDFLFTTVDGSGALSFENRQSGKKGMLWKGYYVNWKRPYEANNGDAKEDKKPGSRPSRSTRKGISPLVIEVK